MSPLPWVVAGGEQPTSEAVVKGVQVLSCNDFDIHNIICQWISFGTMVKEWACSCLPPGSPVKAYLLLGNLRVA